MIALFLFLVFSLALSLAEVLKPSQKRFAYLAVLFILGIAYQGFAFNKNPSFLDVGFQMNSAWRVSEGQVPYRDFFSLITPLHFYIYSLPIKLFGRDLATLFWFTAVLNSVGLLFVYLIAERITSRAFAVMTWLAAGVLGLAFMGMVPTYAGTAFMFAFVAVYSLIRYYETDRGKWLILAGLMLAATLWSKQTLGIYLCLGFLPLLARPRSIPLVVGGFAILTIPLLGYLWLKGAIPAMIIDTYSLPASTFAKEAKVYPPSLGQITLADQVGFQARLYFGAIALIILSFAVALFSKADRRVWTVVLAAAGLFVLTQERFSVNKLVATLPLILVALTFVLWRFSVRYPQIRSTSLVGLFSLSLYGMFLSYDARPKQMDGADRLEFATEFMRDNHDSKIIALPMSPLYYFESGYMNPTRFDLPIPANMSESDKAEYLSELKTADYLIFDEYWTFDGRPFSNYQPTMQKAIETEFELFKQGPGTLQVYKLRKRNHNPAAVIDVQPVVSGIKYH